MCPSVSLPVFVATTVIGLIAIRQIRVWSWGRCKSKRSLVSQVVIITGANSGLGKATAVELAARGAYVVLACRDPEKGRETIKAILRLVPTCSPSNLSVIELDLASLESVHNFVREFRLLHDHLNVLINNAGVMGCDYALTVDDVETQMSVNHLGPFLLTNLLTKDLKKCAPSRIIFVTSTLAKKGKIVDFKQTGNYNRRGAYADSKLANYLYAIELNKRLDCSDGIGIYLASPGHVWTKLGRHIQPPWWKTLFLMPLLLPLAYLFVRTPKQGCQTIVHCALEDGLESGAFYRDCRRTLPPKDILKHQHLATSVWDNSLEVVNLISGSTPTEV